MRTLLNTRPSINRIMPLKETTAQRKLIHSKQVADGKLEWLCIRCNKEHPKESFLTKRNGYRMKCIICAETEAAANAKYRATHIEKVYENRRFYDTKRKQARCERIRTHIEMVESGCDTLLCTKCNKLKPVLSFRSHTGKITKHCYECRQYEHIVESKRTTRTRERIPSERKKTPAYYMSLKYCMYRRYDINKGYCSSSTEFETLFPRKVAYSLMKSKCLYCGFIEPGKIGIDRVNPSLPHITINCVPCCETCNVAKNTMSLRKFVEHIKDMERTTRPLRLTPLGNMECPF